MIDNSANGRGKGGWTGRQPGDRGLVLPGVQPDGAAGPDRRQCDSGRRSKQIGYYRADGSVETGSHPGANAVNLLVETVVLNYMALHGEQAQFASHVPEARPRQHGTARRPHGLRSPSL